jgi:pantoate--beta-alanine ligase
VDYSIAMSGTIIIRTNSEMQRISAQWQEKGDNVALIPTMGALHAGHLAHIGPAREHAARVVVSIFVNPTQFAPHEDFSRYPRALEADAEKLRSAGGVDAIYAPEVSEIYPEGAKATAAVTDGPAAGLETEFRPHFFGGVVTVVERLFRQVRPNFATFGEKDYQQMLVVRRLADQLGMGIKIVPIPIVREKDGLALSSRNAYLSDKERMIAPALYRTIQNTAERVRSGRGIAQAEAEATAAILSSGFGRVDYCVVRDVKTLHPVRETMHPARVLAAAWLGKTRLIDNVPV